MKKENRGITLVALVITIIILLILAVVSIMAVTGTGLFSKTSDAVDKYENSREKENSVFGDHIDSIDEYSNSKTDPIVGSYATTISGITARAIFYSDYTCKVYEGDFEAEGTWTYEDGVYVVKGDHVDFSATLEDDGISLGDVTLYRE